MNYLYLYILVLCSFSWSWSTASPLLRSVVLEEDMHRRSLQSAVGTVTRFRLINATTRNRGEVLVDPLSNGAVINLYNYPVNQMLSIEAVATNSTGPLGTVRFTFANRTNFRTEDTAPYSLCGDSGGSFRNCSQLTVLGVYTLTATPFSERPGTSVMGTPYSIQFTVVNVPPSPAPVVAPTKSPTKLPTKAPTKTPTKTPTATPYDVLTGQWIEVDKNASITPRHEACFVMVGNKAYLLSGRGVKPVDIYDPVTRTWTAGPVPPLEIHHTQCVAADNKIWIVSSWTGGYPRERNTDSIYVSHTRKRIPFGYAVIYVFEILTNLAMLFSLA
jgi:large repetitive protein